MTFVKTNYSCCKHSDIISRFHHGSWHGSSWWCTENTKERQEILKWENWIFCKFFYQFKFFILSFKEILKWKPLIFYQFLHPLKLRRYSSENIQSFLDFFIHLSFISFKWAALIFDPFMLSLILPSLSCWHHLSNQDRRRRKSV